MKNEKGENPLATVLGGLGFIDKETVGKFTQHYIDMANEAGTPMEVIERLERETEGGNCPQCGKSYIKTETLNQFADFEWYRPQCLCEEKQEDVKKKGDVMNEKLRAAGIPSKLLKYNFGQWDYRVEKKINEAFKVVYNYAMEKKYESKGLILYGDVGTGKTHCAVAALKEVVDDGKSPIFVPMANLVSELMRKGENFQNRIVSADIVLLDDMDKIGTAQNAWVKERIFSLINDRIAQGRVIFGTTNFKGPEDFDEKFGDAVMSRLIESCVFVKFEGSDYRAVKRKLEEE